MGDIDLFRMHRQDSEQKTITNFHQFEFREENTQLL